MTGKTIKKSIRVTLLLLTAFLMFFALTHLKAEGKDGKTVYESNCTVCHGHDGKGNKGAARAMGTPVSKLDLTKSETMKKSDAELEKIVRDGNGKMKPFKDKLNGDDISAVIKYIRSLKK